MEIYLAGALKGNVSKPYRDALSIMERGGEEWIYTSPVYYKPET